MNQESALFGCICSLRKQISPAGSGQKAREERLREDDKHYREQEREGRKAEEEALREAQKAREGMPYPAAEVPG